ncbi:hypothetical protein T08_13234 [Trichinella sp. T8]|nr:hypothetical protein T08_13234 [Trichinella sp. T8]
MNDVLKCYSKTELLEHVIIYIGDSMMCCCITCTDTGKTFYTALTIKQTRKCLFERSTSY